MNEQTEQTRHPDLFRSVAVEASAGSHIGEPLVAYWRGVKVFTFVAFAMVGLLFAFLCVAEYSKVHRIRAYVDSRGGLARVTSPVDGQITRIAVTDGARVEPGAVLAVLTSDKLNADGGSYRYALRQRLDEELETIQKEVNAATEEMAANGILISRRLTGFRQEREQLQADIKSAEQLLQSLRRQSERLASVAADGFATRSQLDQKRDEVAAQESRLATSRGLLARIDRDISTSEAEKRLVEAKLAGTVQSRKRAGVEVERLILQNSAQAEQAVHATRSGTVSAALISIGQSVAAGQVLFTIAPIDDPMVVRLLVPARSAAAAKVGTEIKLVFQAYPQEKFGNFDTTIQSISATATLPSDSAGVYAATAEPIFVAVAPIPQQLRSASGESVSLKPGMLADALIPLERRSVIAWMFDPILRGFNESAGAARVSSERGELQR